MTVADDRTDEMLVARYRAGDRGAFAELVHRWNKAVYNFCLRQCGSGAAAEELTQEAFLRVVQTAERFDPSSRFRTWLFTIARNLCIDHARRQRFRRHGSLDGPAGPKDARSLGETLAEALPRGDAEREQARTELQARMLEAISGLPDDQREAFLLRHVCDLPFREVAEVVGANENTVKSRVRYALEQLRVALEPFEEYAKALR